MTQETGTMRSGFTLLETLLATVVAGLLLMAALGVLSLLSRDAARLASREPGSETVRVEALVRHDLLNARAMVLLEDGRGLRLEGPLAMDPRKRVWRNTPALVTYRILEEPAGYLVREQRELTGASLSREPPPIRELVSANVRHFGLRTGATEAESREPTTAGARPGDGDGVADRPQPLTTGAVELLITWQNGEVLKIHALR